MSKRRRWLDGPGWLWLCRIRHEKKRWLWYSYCNTGLHWWYEGIGCMKGWVCTRCGKEFEY